MAPFSAEMDGNLERRFFKVMMPGFEQKLRVPPAFSAEIRDEKWRWVTLESRKGMWEMKLRRRQNELSLGDGWSRFVRDHALSVGDFLVFQRQRHLHFTVSVFDPSASENLFPLSSPPEVGGNWDAIGRQFFKIMLPGFEEKLKLPPAFCEEIKQEKSKTAILESRKGRWEMDVYRKDDEIYLQDGWPQFGVDHALSERDLLVLEHTRHFHFHVAVFDSSACEKMFVAQPKKQHQVPNPPCDGAKATTKAPSCSKINERSIAGKGRQKSGEASSRQRQAFFSVKMTDFSASSRGIVVIPNEFVSRNNLVEKRRLVLRDGGGRKWEVALIAQQSIGRLRMGRGWHGFCGGNEVKVGDVCVFKLHPSSLTSTTILLDVTILKNSCFLHP